MKKLLLFAAILTSQVDLYGQAVPNGSFESWNSTPYDELNGWESGNKESIPQMGITCVTKVTGYTGFAARMQTSVISGDTTHAYIAMGDPKGYGGVPYSQKPTAITGYYRYNLPGNDTALIIVTFKKNGSIVSEDLFKIRGTGNQPTFTAFSFSLALSVTPDTVIVAAAASNLMSGIGIQNGSFLELDKLIFTGISITQQLSNNEFENWTAKSFDIPSGWQIWGSDVTKTNDKYAGSYAIRLETMNQDWGTEPSGITTGYMTDTAGPAGGLPYTNTNDTLCGYYKYTSMGGSNAGIYVSLYKNGGPVGGNNKSLPGASSYTYFEVPFQAGTAPDTMRIDIQSSGWPVTSANAGSVLYIDNLYLKSSPSVGIFENKLSILNSFSYPNPVKDVLFIRFGKANSDIMNLHLYDITGKEVEYNNYNRHSTSMSIDVANLPPGMYFYEIRVSEGIMRNKFVRE